MAKIDAPPMTNRSALRRNEVAAGIKDYILVHQLKPGDPLPTEAELCEAIGASRSSVREAVKTLSALDIVDVRHGHGTYVGRMSLAGLVESLAFRGLLSSEDDHLVLGQVVEVRQTLEQGLAAQMTSLVDDEQLRRLRSLATGMAEAAERGEDYLELDREFHLLLMEPLGNDLIQQLTGAFWEVQSIVTPTLGAEHRSALTLTAALHMAIVEAVEARDPAALREAVARHYDPIRSLIASVRRPSA